MATRNVYSWVLAAVLMAASPSLAGEAAQAREASTSDTVTIVLTDGSRLVGTIAAEDAASITIRTAAGLELRLSRDTIASVERGRRSEPPPAEAPVDPNDTRLMFA